MRYKHRIYRVRTFILKMVPNTEDFWQNVQQPAHVTFMVLTSKPTCGGVLFWHTVYVMWVFSRLSWQFEYWIFYLNSRANLVFFDRSVHWHVINLLANEVLISLWGKSNRYMLYLYDLYTCFLCILFSLAVLVMQVTIYASTKNCREQFTLQQHVTLKIIIRTVVRRVCQHGWTEMFPEVVKCFFFFFRNRKV